MPTRKYRSKDVAMEAIESRQLLTGTAIIHGTVFRDANHNAVQDNGEVGQQGARVYVDFNNNGVRDGDAEPLQTTNNVGAYTFAGIIAPETIRVRLLLTGTEFVQSRPVNNAPRTVVTAPGGEYTLESFGIYEKAAPPPVTTAVISGNVFTDLNQNATRDTNEKGRPNVLVYLDLNNDGIRETGEPALLTSATGTYKFEMAPVRNDLHIRLDLSAGNLFQTLPTNNAARVLATVAGQTYVDQNFGVHESSTNPPVTTGTIRGRVFNDVNHDGKQEAGDLGVPGRNVYLDVNHSGYRDDGDPQVLTDNAGNYIFTKVLPGTYAVRLYRGGLVQTSPPNDGSNVATVTAGSNIGDLFFGTYLPEHLVSPTSGANPIAPIAEAGLGDAQKTDGRVASQVLA